MDKPPTKEELLQKKKEKLATREKTQKEVEALQSKKKRVEEQKEDTTKEVLEIPESEESKRIEDEIREAEKALTDKKEVLKKQVEEIKESGTKSGKTKEELAEVLTEEELLDYKEKEEEEVEEEYDLETKEGQEKKYLKDLEKAMKEGNIEEAKRLRKEMYEKFVKEEPEEPEEPQIVQIEKTEMEKKLEALENKARELKDAPEGFRGKILKGMEKWENFGKGEPGAKGYIKRFSKMAVTMALIGAISSVSVQKLAEAGVGTATALGGGVMTAMGRKMAMGLGMGAIMQAEKVPSWIKKAMPYMVSAGMIGASALITGGVAAVPIGITAGSMFLGYVTSKLGKGNFTQEKIEERQNEATKKLIEKYKRRGGEFDEKESQEFEKEYMKIRKKYETRGIFGKLGVGVRKILVGSAVSAVAMEVSGMTRDIATHHQAEHQAEVKAEQARHHGAELKQQEETKNNTETKTEDKTTTENKDNTNNTSNTENKNVTDHTENKNAGDHTENKNVTDHTENKNAGDHTENKNVTDHTNQKTETPPVKNEQNQTTPNKEEHHDQTTTENKNNTVNNNTNNTENKTETQTTTTGSEQNNQNQVVTGGQNQTEGYQQNPVAHPTYHNYDYHVEDNTHGDNNQLVHNQETHTTGGEVAKTSDGVNNTTTEKHVLQTQEAQYKAHGSMSKDEQEAQPHHEMTKSESRHERHEARHEARVDARETRYEHRHHYTNTATEPHKPHIATVEEDKSNITTTNENQNANTVIDNELNKLEHSGNLGSIGSHDASTFMHDPQSGQLVSIQETLYRASETTGVEPTHGETISHFTERLHEAVNPSHHVSTEDGTQTTGVHHSSPVEIKTDIHLESEVIQGVPQAQFIQEVGNWFENHGTHWSNLSHAEQARNLWAWEHFGKIEQHGDGFSLTSPEQNNPMWGHIMNEKLPADKILADYKSSGPELNNIGSHLVELKNSVLASTGNNVEPKPGESYWDYLLDLTKQNY